MKKKSGKLDSEKELVMHFFFFLVRLISRKGGSLKTPALFVLFDAFP